MLYKTSLDEAIKYIDIWNRDQGLGLTFVGSRNRRVAWYRGPFIIQVMEKIPGAINIELNNGILLHRDSWCEVLGKYIQESFSEYESNSIEELEQSSHMLRMITPNIIRWFEKNPIRGVEIIDGEQRIINNATYNEWEKEYKLFLEVTASARAEQFLGNEPELHRSEGEITSDQIINNELFITSIGRPTVAANDWAYTELLKEKNRKDVFKEWKVRHIAECGAFSQMSSPKDIFKSAINYRKGIIRRKV
jgi:hypothetical protein